MITFSKWFLHMVWNCSPFVYVFIVDAVAAATERVGFSSVRLAFNETGWVTVGAAGNVGSLVTALGQVRVNMLV